MSMSLPIVTLVWWAVMARVWPMRRTLEAQMTPYSRSICFALNRANRFIHIPMEIKNETCLARSQSSSIMLPSIQFILVNFHSHPEFSWIPLPVFKSERTFMQKMFVELCAWFRPDHAKTSFNLILSYFFLNERSRGLCVFLAGKTGSSM